MIQQSIELRIS